MSEAEANLKALALHAREAAEKRSGLTRQDERLAVAHNFLEVFTEIKSDMYVAAVHKARHDGDLKSEDLQHMLECSDCHRKVVTFALEYILSAYGIKNYSEIIEEFINEGNND
jgi:hypothetical protein